jgi:DNA sulfur modification protein DndC
MYQGATSDGECPLVVDTSTPSCGDSRFGCYVCTMVGEDKSMSAMIQNDDEKEWMLPLLELRTKWLDITDPNVDKKNKKIDIEREHREFKRMNGALTLHNGRLVHGPYKQSYRAKLLEAVLEAEKVARELCPEEVKDLELISIEELEEIRRIWCIEKHEIEDILPSVYEKVTGKSYPGKALTDYQLFNTDDLDLLKQVCNEDSQDNEGLHYELVRDLLHIENTHDITGKRASLLSELEKILDESAFSSEAEALEFAKARQLSRDRINERNGEASEDSLLFEDVMQEVQVR